MKKNAPAPESCALVCKVTPNARKSECVGWGRDEQGREVLLVKLAAPALDGKANKELLRFMAELLGCAKSGVALLRGEASRTKVVSIPCLWRLVCASFEGLTF